MDLFLSIAGVIWFCFIIYTLIKALGLNNPSRLIRSFERRRQSKQITADIRSGRIPCYRCDGTGFIPHCEHIYDGICFVCDGYTPYGRYGTSEYKTRRHQAAIRARNDPPEPRPQFLAKRTRYYDRLTIEHLQGILDSNSDLQDDEIEVIQRIQESKRQSALEPPRQWRIKSGC
tara:strand:- start:4739 stop:5260 length:522 start_codon:yes stop_codon:yes gene_type:complete